MAQYLVKRSIPRSGVKVFGPVDDVGQALPGARTQKLVFNQGNIDIASADLIAGQWYDVTARFYGDRGTELELATKPRGGAGVFEDWCSFTIPDDFEGDATHFEFFQSDSKLAKVS